MFKAENCSDSNVKFKKKKPILYLVKRKVYKYTRRCEKCIHEHCNKEFAFTMGKELQRKRFTHKTGCTKCCKGDDTLKDIKFDLTFAFYWGNG